MSAAHLLMCPSSSNVRTLHGQHPCAQEGKKWLKMFYMFY